MGKSPPSNAPATGTCVMAVFVSQICLFRPRPTDHHHTRWIFPHHEPSYHPTHQQGSNRPTYSLLPCCRTRFACKRIPKQRPASSVLDGPISKVQSDRYRNSVYLEVDALRRLRGSLNVVHLEDVFEDDTYVYLITELCLGGPIWDPAEKFKTVPATPNFTERRVATAMRDVMRTLVQFHARRLLHRDVKPGNFLLASTAEGAPLKAIDMGLAAPYTPGQVSERCSR